MSAESIALQNKLNTLNLVEFAEFDDDSHYVACINDWINYVPYTPFDGVNSGLTLVAPLSIASTNAVLLHDDSGYMGVSFAPSALKDGSHTHGNLAVGLMMMVTTTTPLDIFKQTDTAPHTTLSYDGTHLVFNGDQVTKIAMPLNQSFLVVASLSDTNQTLTMYVDGVVIGSVAMNPNDVIDGDSAYYIGNNSVVIDDMFVLDQSVTAVEVNEIKALVATQSNVVAMDLRMSFNRIVAPISAATAGADTMLMLNEGMANDELRVQFTDAGGTVLRELMSSIKLNTKLISSLTGFNTVQVAVDMDARDALGLANNIMVMVTDPRTGTNADATVATGSALYFYDAAIGDPATAWLKIAEDESFDVPYWDQMLNAPVATNPEWEALVANDHFHANHATLEGITEDGDSNLVYNEIPLDGAATAIVGW